MERAVVYYLSRMCNLQTERVKVKRFMESHFEQVAEFIEYGKGTARQHWPVLKEAIEAVKNQSARLIIAHLGRLKWNVSFLRHLNTGVPFLCLDFPDLFEDTISTQVQVAQNRAQRIGRVSKDGLRQVKGFTSAIRRRDPRFKKGVKKGGRNSGKLRKAKAKAVYILLLPKMQQLRGVGKTYDEVAEALNVAGHTTTIGTTFNGPTVYRIMHR